MIYPVRIHGIFEQSDKSVNSKGLDSKSWLAKKDAYRDYLDSLKIYDESIYDRLLEEFDEGLLFNINFRFLITNLGYGEDVADALVDRFDAGEKPYGTVEIVKPKTDKNYTVKDNYLNISVDPNQVAALLSAYRQVNDLNTTEVKRGR